MKSLLSKDEKTKLLETIRSSGQTQAAFAEVNGINPKTLARWIYQQRFEAGQNQKTGRRTELPNCVYENDRPVTKSAKEKRIIEKSPVIPSLLAHVFLAPFSAVVFPQRTLMHISSQESHFLYF